jgi:hypothetical protein
MRETQESLAGSDVAPASMGIQHSVRSLATHEAPTSSRASPMRAPFKGRVTDQQISALVDYLLQKGG